MTNDTMLHDAMTGTVARLRVEHFPLHRSTAAAKVLAEKVASGRESRPQRLKPHLRQWYYRSGKPLRHPTSSLTTIFSAACKAHPEDKSVLSPALKRRAIFERSSRAGLGRAAFHPVAPRRVLTHTLKRSATQNLAAIFTIIAVVISLLLSMSASAQTQDQTPAQMRQRLLQDLDSGQLPAAILLGEKAVARWRRDAQFRHYLGLAYFKSGDLKQAQEQLTQARDLNPKDSATHYDLALVLLSGQNYPAAADELEATLKLSRSSNALAHVLLGRAYLNSNRSLQAIDEFKTALKLDPAIKLGHYHLGFAYSSLGRNDDAMSEYKEELRRSGESPAVVYELGRSLLEAGKYDAAVTYLQRATELDAQNPDAWYNLGKAQALAGQAAQAEASLRKAAERNPKDPSPHYQLARVLEKLGKSEEAQSERQRFAELKRAQPASAGMATGRDQ
jgi:tetratricopeptide (TPR) repeat protein